MQFSGLEEFLNSFPAYEPSPVEAERKWEMFPMNNPVEMFIGLKANSEE